MKLQLQPFAENKGKIVDHRSCKDDAVKAVHDSAVSGDQCAVVLDRVIALDGGGCKITGLADQASYYTDDQKEDGEI